MKRAMMLLAASVFALAACEEKKPEATPTTDDSNAKNAPAVTATPAPAEPVVVIDEADLATPADFEEAAETSITKANYKKELAVLETDIAKEE